jgi:hypothetical protein
MTHVDVTFHAFHHFGPVMFSLFLKPILFGCGLSEWPYVNIYACAQETNHLLVVILSLHLCLSLIEMWRPLLPSLGWLLKWPQMKTWQRLEMNDANDAHGYALILYISNQPL